MWRRALGRRALRGRAAHGTRFTGLGGHRFGGGLAAPARPATAAPTAAARATRARLGRGFFDGWGGEDCGEIKPVSISLMGGPCVAAASGGLQFQNIMIEGLNFGMSTGALEITEGITMRFGSMNRA